MNPFRTCAVIAVAVTAAITVAACAADSTAPTRIASQSMPTSAQGGLTPLGDASMAEKTQRPEEPRSLVVTGVRTGTHDGFDRVVFDLEGEGTPGWFVDYTNSPTQQGSGTPIKVNGQTFLDVNIDGVVPINDSHHTTPEITTVEGTGSVTEVVNAGLSGDRAQFIVGLEKEGPYSVQILEDPLRIVIDIRT